MSKILWFLAILQHATSLELNTMAINHQQLACPHKTSTPSATAGSAAQLPRVEAEMRHTPNTTQVVKRPFQVKLKWLTQAEIMFHTGRTHEPTSAGTPSATYPQTKPCSVKLYKLSPGFLCNTLKTQKEWQMKPHYTSSPKTCSSKTRNKPQTVTLKSPANKPSSGKSPSKRKHMVKVQQHVLKNSEVKCT